MTYENEKVERLVERILNQGRTPSFGDFDDIYDLARAVAGCTVSVHAPVDQNNYTRSVASSDLKRITDEAAVVSRAVREFANDERKDFIGVRAEMANSLAGVTIIPRTDALPDPKPPAASMPPKSPIEIYVVILSGGNREDKILRAVGSVLSIADRVVLVDTGDSADAAIRKVCSALSVPMVSIVEATHRNAEHRCSDARNDGLAYAKSSPLRESVTLWALMLDTDEVLNLNGFDVRGYLAATQANVIQVFCDPHSQSRYTKERFIRIPAAGRYVSGGEADIDVHEEFLGDGIIREVMPTVTFSEDAKSPEEFAAAMHETERKCRAWLERDKMALRPRFYLGNTLHYFGEKNKDARVLQEAIEHYLEYASRVELDHEVSWSTFRAAQCYHLIAQLGSSPAENINTALRVLGPAMTRDPHCTELFVMAAQLEAALGHADKSEAWTALAIGAGNTTGMTRLPKTRLGFQFPPAAWETPWEIRASVFASVVEHGKSNGVATDKLAAYEREAQRSREISIMSKAQRVGVM